MRVIKVPENVDAWRELCKCTRCSAELEYSLNDVKAEFISNFREDSYWNYEITCPVCRSRNKIPDVKFSNYAKFYIQSKR